MGRSIRNAARAVILKGDRILTIRAQDRSGLFYGLPGGDQRGGELLTETVQRECLSELGAEVTVERILFIREVVGRNAAFAKIASGTHHLEVVFLCSFTDPAAFEAAASEIGHTNLNWMELRAAGAYRFYPEALLEYVKDGELKVTELYRGLHET